MKRKDSKNIQGIVIRVIVSVVILVAMSLIATLVKNAKEEAQTVRTIKLESKPISQTVEAIEKDPYEIAVLSMQKEMDEINKIEDEKEWFLYYLEIIDKYSHIIDPPETIYDYFTEEEIYLIYRAVETECFDASFQSKSNVASVIFNRIDSGEFGNSVEQIITSKNQFAYGREKITEDTIIAVRFAFEIKDTTNGCIAFRSDDKPDTWYDWGYQFTDNAGHNFYKEIDDE